MENTAPLQLIEPSPTDSAGDAGLLHPPPIREPLLPAQVSAHSRLKQLFSTQLLGQLVRFGAVGLLNTGVDLGVLNGLIYLRPAGRSGLLYSAFKTIAFTVAVTNSYLLNRRFTFKSQKAASSGQLTQYLLISVVGLLINVGIATLVMSLVTPPPVLTPWWPSIAAMSGIPFGLIWNFVGYRLLVF